MHEQFVKMMWSYLMVVVGLGIFVTVFVAVFLLLQYVLESGIFSVAAGG